MKDMPLQSSEPCLLASIQALCLHCSIRINQLERPSTAPIDYHEYFTALLPTDHRMTGWSVLCSDDCARHCLSQSKHLHISANGQLLDS